MKKIYKIMFGSLICLALIMASSVSMIGFAQQQDTSEISIEGIWEGKLKVPGGELRIVFKISENPDGTLTATMDSPDQEQLASRWKKSSLKIMLCAWK